jgi:hypothetical protein
MSLALTGSMQVIDKATKPRKMRNVPRDFLPLHSIGTSIILSDDLKVCRNSAGFVFEPRLCEERTVEPFLNNN